MLTKFPSNGWRMVLILSRTGQISVVVQPDVDCDVGAADSSRGLLVEDAAALELEVGSGSFDLHIDAQFTQVQPNSEMSELRTELRVLFGFSAPSEPELRSGSGSASVVNLTAATLVKVQNEGCGTRTLRSTERSVMPEYYCCDSTTRGRRAVYPAICGWGKRGEYECAAESYSGVYPSREPRKPRADKEHFFEHVHSECANLVSCDWTIDAAGQGGMLGLADDKRRLGVTESGEEVV
ncbi:hypothetical protein B0H10DRAFT_2320326 [Mycena sp. CBHHK59/15]|nr:hypothetical protein B0H10DRAFT_2320326 [Mycena sp. CBHHK59/15]